MATTLHLLHTLQLTCDDAPMASAANAGHSQQAHLLLAYLVLNQHSPQPRPHLAELFWDEHVGQPRRKRHRKDPHKRSPGQIRSNFRTLLFRLKQVDCVMPHLHITPTHVQWRPAPHDAGSDPKVWVDVHEFEHLIQLAKAEKNGQRIRLLEQAIALYRGELLYDYDKKWVTEKREALSVMHDQALTQVIVAYEIKQDYASAIGYALKRLQKDEQCEPAYVELVRLYKANNQRSNALAAYERYATLMRSQNLPLSESMQALYAQLTEPATSTAYAIKSVNGALVGRQSEWELLTGMWRKLTESAISPVDSQRPPIQPHYVLVRGEYGIGKSHLVRRFAHWARTSMGTVVIAACRPASQSLAYAPLLDWLHQLPLDHLSAANKQQLAQLLPELQPSVASQPTAPTLPSPPHNGDRAQRLRLYQALALAFASQPGPLLLVLDDVQWCDAETLAWLSYFMQQTAVGQLAQPSVMLLATAHSSELPAQHEARRLLQREGRYVELHLGRLSPADTRDLANELHPSPLLSPELHAKIYQHSEGNPWVVRELLGMGIAALTTDTLCLPDAVRELILRWVSRLPAPIQAMLTAAAVLVTVLSQPFSLSQLAAVSGLDVAQAAAYLVECEALGLVQVAAVADRYQFTHSKIAAALYHSIPPIRLGVLVGRVMFYKNGK